MKRTPVTWILIALNVAVFFITAAMSGYQFDIPHMVHFGADVGVLTLAGEWWRLVSSTFLHFGFLHVASNMVCLVYLGRLAERHLGSWVFLGAYLLVGVAGSVASGAVHPLVVSAGASGAVFGTAGLLLPVLGSRLKGIPTAGQELGRVVRFVVYNLLYSFAPGVDATAHFGGFIAGVALGFALWTSPVATLSPRRLALTMAAAFMVVVVGAGEARYVSPGFPAAAAALAAPDLPLMGDSIFFQLPPHIPIPSPTAAPDIRALEKHLASAPDSPSAYVALAAAYGNVGSVQEAVSVLRRGVRRMPLNVELLTALGSAELNTEDFDRAVFEFQQALKLSAGSADSRFNLATALFDRAQRESGRRSAQDSLRADVQRILALPADTNEEMKSLRLAARQLLAK